MSDRAPEQYAAPRPLELTPSTLAQLLCAVASIAGHFSAEKHGTALRQTGRPRAAHRTHSGITWSKQLAWRLKVSRLAASQATSQPVTLTSGERAGVARPSPAAGGAVAESRAFVAVLAQPCTTNVNISSAADETAWTAFMSARHLNCRRRSSLPTQAK